MSRDRGVPSRACQILSIFVRNVLTLAILVALGQSEVDDVDVVACRIGSSDQEVIRFDIPMNDSLFMDFLYASDELACDHKYSLEVEITLARLEEVLKRRSQQVHHHHVELLIWN